jgi:hypothetical protein
MTREVSRRTSVAPEAKARVSRPDVTGLRDLAEHIVEDRSDPTLRGSEMDAYFQQLPATMIDCKERRYRPRALPPREPNGE